MNIRKKTLILLLSACCSVASQTVAMTAHNDVSTYNTNFNDHKEEKKEAEKKKKNVSKADEIIAHAMRYRGKAYRRGASGPNAFDCSGFTGFVFRKANIELKRSSREQFTQGVAVNRSDLQPGDLVFFSSPRKVPWRMHTFLPLTIALRFVDLSAYEVYNVFNLLQLHHYLVYFFFGIYFFRFRLYKFFDGMGIFFVLLCIYLGLALTNTDFGTASAGIMLMVSLSRLLEKPLPGLCRHWRDYVFQVYLMGMICQGVVELVIWKRWCYNESFFAVFYVLNIAAGLYIPVLVAKMVERCPVKFIRLCFGLK